MLPVWAGIVFLTFGLIGLLARDQLWRYTVWMRRLGGWPLDESERTPGWERTETVTAASNLFLGFLILTLVLFGVL